MPYRELIIDHDYRSGTAFDRSMNGNHGYRTAKVGEVGGRSGLFFAGTGRVIVPPSQTLASLGAVRIEVEFYLSTRHWPHRRNLVEGHMAFALIVNPDRSLTGTFYNTQVWDGPKSAAGVLPTGRWVIVTYIYDGVGGGQLYLDGNQIAMRSDLDGTVPGVTSGGVEVGHWPAGDDRYTMDGYIGAFRLWRIKDDPLPGLLCGTKYSKEQNPAWRKILQLLSGERQKVLSDYAVGLSEMIRWLAQIARRNRPFLNQRLAELGRFYYQLVCVPCGQRVNSRSEEMKRLLDEIMRTLADAIPLDDRIEALRRFREWEEANPTPMEIREARTLLRQADPATFHLELLASTALKRHLLSDVPKEFWPRDFRNGGEQ